MHLKVGKFTTTTEAYRGTKLQFRRLGDQNRLFPAGRDGARLCRHADAHGSASVAGAWHPGNPGCRSYRRRDEKWDVPFRPKAASAGDQPRGS